MKASHPSGIQPTEFKVLIKPKAVEDKVGSIIIPEQVKDRDQFAQMEGELVAVSPLAFTYVEQWPAGAEKPKVGDKVLFAKYSGATVTGLDKVEYRIVNDKDIAAVLA